MKKEFSVLQRSGIAGRSVPAGGFGSARLRGGHRRRPSAQNVETMQQGNDPTVETLPDGQTDEDKTAPDGAAVATRPHADGNAHRDHDPHADGSARRDPDPTPTAAHCDLTPRRRRRPRRPRRRHPPRNRPRNRRPP